MDEKKPRDYKKATIITVVLTVAALAVTVFSLALRPESAVPTQGTPAESISSYYTPKPTSSQETTASPIPSSDGPYRVALYDGKIGVFRPGESTPYLTADVSVYLLPEEDIALLRKGITAQNLTEVKRILEDYD